MTTTTIDPAALAADLEALGWIVMLLKHGEVIFAQNDDWHISIPAGHPVRIDCFGLDEFDETCAIDLTDPIWAKALPILLRHVAGEGGEM